MVTVGVVAGATAVEPDHPLDAQIIVKGLLQLRFGDTRVALLDFAQQALFGGEQDAFAVGVDRAALQNQAMLLAVIERRGGLEQGHRVEIGNVPGNEVVVVPVGVLRPGVEAPVGDSQIADLLTD